MMKMSQEMKEVVIHSSVLLFFVFLAWLCETQLGSSFWAFVFGFIAIVVFAMMFASDDKRRDVNEKDITDLEDRLNLANKELDSIKREYHEYKIKSTDTIASLKARCIELQKNGPK